MVMYWGVSSDPRFALRNKCRSGAVLGVGTRLVNWAAFPRTAAQSKAAGGVKRWAYSRDF